MTRLFHKYYPVRGMIFFLIEGGLIFSGVWLLIWLNLSGVQYYDPAGITVWIKILFITVIVQTSLYYHNLYDFSSKTGFSALILHIIQATGIACLVLAAFYYFLPQLILERGFFLVVLFLMFLVLVSWRLLYQYVCQQQLWNERILLVGDGRLAGMIGNEISNNMDSGYTVKAIFSNPGNTGLAEKLGVEKSDNYDGLCEYALNNGIRKIVVALEERRGHSPVRALLHCKMQGLKILEGASFYEALSGKILAGSITPSWLVFSDGFRRNRIKIVAKRCFDILFSLSGIILSAPLQIIVAILIKTTSSGPVFFKQTRVGQMEKKFDVIKFRTMHDNAENESGAVWAEKNDVRITPVGRIFRKLRLDELPQFWNVLKGEMSFVGPRPERPVFVEQLKKVIPYYGERHTVKPGITGWAQVNYGYGASEDDALRKLEYDLFYIKHLSLVFDLYIVLKTIKTVLFGGSLSR